MVTKIIFIKNNGFDPHFNELFQIGRIDIPEVSFLKIRVCDKDGGFMGKCLSMMPLNEDDFGELYIE